MTTQKGSSIGRFNVVLVLCLLVLLVIGVVILFLIVKRDDSKYFEPSCTTDKGKAGPVGACCCIIEMYNVQSFELGSVSSTCVALCE